MSLFVTHYGELTHLEQENPKSFKNFKVELEETAQGLKRNYKLQEGKSTQHLAIEVALERDPKNEIIKKACEEMSK